ncbi:hypothetical protein J7M28_01105 [bacterium]|nr:hypothetical protein [bacterium]
MHKTLGSVFFGRIIYHFSRFTLAARMGPVVMSIIVFLAVPSQGATDPLYVEVNLIGGYSSTERWLGRSMSQKNALGFEYFRKFSNEYGDYLTGDFQLRLAYDPTYSRRDAWAIEVHNAWAEYKIGLGKKLRAGHFAPAFGLEPLIDTHGTILQTLAPMNIGFKKDWGLGFSGILGAYDYQLAAQIGSGMGLRRRDSSCLFSGRIGSPAGNDLQYGLSLLYGATLKAKSMSTIPRPDLVQDDAVLKKRVGLDAQYIFGSYVFKAEGVFGENDGMEVAGGLFEVDYTVPDLQELELQLQASLWDNDPSDGETENTSMTVGLEYAINSDLTLRAAWSTDCLSDNSTQKDEACLQVYYFAPF